MTDNIKTIREALDEYHLAQTGMSRRYAEETYNEARAALDALESEMAQLTIRRRESRGLLQRLVKYVHEDRAVTPGKTRLARLAEQVGDYLNRTHDPSDILRGDARLAPPERCSHLVGHDKKQCREWRPCIVHEARRLAPADSTPGDEEQGLSFWLDAFESEIERSAEAMASRGRGGRTTGPSSADFAHCPPSTIGRLRRWLRELRSAHLRSQHPETDAILSALRNMGHDVTCGACIGVAFSGVTTAAHSCQQPETEEQRAERDLLAALRTVFAWCREHEEATPPMPVFHEFMSRADGLVSKCGQWRVAIPRDGKVTLEGFIAPEPALIALADALAKARDAEGGK